MCIRDSHEHPVDYAPVADSNLFKPELLHYCFKDSSTPNDYVCPIGVDAPDLFSLIKSKRAECRNYLPQIFIVQDEVSSCVALLVDIHSYLGQVDNGA